MNETEGLTLMRSRTPKFCPFCKQIDQIEWTEFKVIIGEVFYVDNQEFSANGEPIDDYIQVFCSRCEEEIRQEDL